MSAGFYRVPVFVFSFLVAGCGIDFTPALPTARNVLIVLVDTLRADHLGAYGYERETSPHFDEFAANSILFENARAQAPCTFPSVNSLLTSRDPIPFFSKGAGRYAIPAKIPSLADLLREREFLTAAVSASPIVRRTPSPSNEFGGFESAFEPFDEQCLYQAAACVNARAFDILDKQLTPGRPFFLYLHYFDPHGPYRPPESFGHPFSGDYTGDAKIANGSPNALEKWRYNSGPKPRNIDAVVSHLVDLYDEEIAYFDGQFQKLLDGLEERALLEETIVVFVSDHGEAFLEDRQVKHCHGVGETQVRTPLAMRIPGASRGLSVSGAVQNLDVVPTVLDYLGIAVDPSITERFEGRSLRNAIEGRDSEEALAFSSWLSERAVIRGQSKLVYNLSTKKHRLYELATDPFERVDRSKDRPKTVSTLLEAVLIRSARIEKDAQRSIKENEAALRRLHALGYFD